MLGIVRTYTTRVGEGPFPTEMLEGEAELGQMIRERGREYGASTGRPRRCGWFDAFATRYAAEINGFTSVALTKLDVLDTLDEIKVCTGYKLNGKTLRIAAGSVAGSASRRTNLRNFAGLEEFNVGYDGDEFPSHRSARLCRLSFRTDRHRDRSCLDRPGTHANDHRA